MENTISIAFPYTNREEFEKKQKALMKEVFLEYLPEIDSKKNSEKLLSRKEVAGLLHISLPTLNNLTKEGTLIGYRLKGRVLYKKSEVISSLKTIVPIKYRKQ